MIVLYGFLIALFVVFPILINLYPSEKGIPYWKKFTPWILFNDDDPIDQPKYDDRYPGKPHWYRVLRHMIRNPCANGCRYTWGFKDKVGLIRKDDMWPREYWIHITPPWIAFKRGRWNGYLGWNCDPSNYDGMNYGALTAAFRRQ